MGRHRVALWVACGVAACLILVGGLASVAVLRDRAEPLSFDDNGKAHGTGSVTYKYTSRAPKLTDQIVDGKLVRSEWFKPDGTSILVTNWKDGSGVGIYVREDGSISVKMTYVHEIANGPATYYGEDGSVVGEAVFKNGQRISGYDPKDQPTDQPFGQKDK